MIAVGQFSDAMRALGRFLQMVRASEIIVIDQPDVVEVSWRGKRGAREEKQYRQWELDALRTWARMVRGWKKGPFNLEPKKPCECSAAKSTC